MGAPEALELGVEPLAPLPALELVGRAAGVDRKGDLRTGCVERVSGGAPGLGHMRDRGVVCDP